MNYIQVGTTNKFDENLDTIVDKNYYATNDWMLCGNWSTEGIYKVFMLFFCEWGKKVGNQNLS